MSIKPCIRYPLALPREEVVKGFAILGQPGSGKTHLYIRLLADLIRAGASVLACCAKMTAWKEVAEACELAGAKDRFDRVKPGGDIRFNLLHHLLTMPGGSPQLAATFFSRVNAVVSSASAEGAGDDAFWRNLFNDAITQSTSLAALAHPRPTVQHVHDAIMTSPATREEQYDAQWRQRSACWQMLLAAQAAAKDDPARQPSYRSCSGFFLNVLGTVGDKARGAVLAMCSGLLGSMVRPPFDRIFCSDDETFTFERWDECGAVIAVDLPVIVYDLPGRVANTVFATLKQMHTFRREDCSRLSVVGRDEAAFFISPQWDLQAQVTGRSHGLVHVDAWQDEDLMVSTLGGSIKAQHEARSFLVNHGYILAGKNASPTTNETISKVIGVERRVMLGGQPGRPQRQTGDYVSDLLGAAGSFSWNEQMQPKVFPHEFIELPTGCFILVAGGGHRLLDLRE